ncbi:ADP-ribosylglycohydrolase family protein [Tenacibaculum sp. M341]|uniref:ADP-ribosylglycohydrolase family protein n=1 Tax=Tenacibaculum sp. M341 TaxID=2530339 RepID=UPI00104ABB27|nr:ADP-ribosylglycohydrolase family protein [Tenacibaculum sp. M341]TCI95065.1 ADP-ribosylglycohydrolase family protein [Tenacibaculum sp. M341]
MNLENKIKEAFFGQAIGDALGVPVEFKSREYLKENPVDDYLAFMCWNQPAGTFSDDSSMMFCTAESLSKKYDIEDIGKTFVKWYTEGYWGAHDEVFDIGGTTRRSLRRIIEGEKAKFSGEFFPENNGNGSLMRILPLVFFLYKEKDINIRFQTIKEVSSITHAHLRSVVSCFIFVEFGILLLSGENKITAYAKMQNVVNDFIVLNGFNAEEVSLFDRILKYKVYELSENQINSGGYVLESIESALWCFMNSNNYTESVLSAVNLGGDTDTTAAINGGLAGMYYGWESIRLEWINGIAKQKEITELALQFYQSVK